MEVLTFNVDADRRGLVKDVQDFNIDFHDSKYNWIQARQYEKQMRQAQVNVKHGDGTPVDLTGANIVFEGWLPDSIHRVIDGHGSVMIDAVNGQFRFDFPAPVFAIAGSYKQAFFRIYRNGQNIATLEFCLEVLADKVISGIVPSDYITPFEDLYGQLEDIINHASGDLKAALTEWTDKFSKLFSNLNSQGVETATMLTTLQAKITSMDILTKPEFDQLIEPINDALDRLTPYIPQGFDVTINHNQAAAPHVYVTYYEYAIGTESGGLNSGPKGTFGGIPINTVANQTEYINGNTCIVHLPKTYALAGTPVYRAGKWYLIDGYKTLCFDLGPVNDATAAAGDSSQL